MDREDLEKSMQKELDNEIEVSVDEPNYYVQNEKPKENGITNLGFQENTALWNKMHPWTISDGLEICNSDTCEIWAVSWENQQSV